MNVQISEQLKAAAQKAVARTNEMTRVRLDRPFDSYLATREKPVDELFYTILSEGGDIFLVVSAP